MSRTNRSPVQLASIATRLAEQHELWQPLIEFDPVSRYYARLAREADFEAWLLTWVPGQGTDWHDHGGSAGAFVTVRGHADRADRDGPAGRPAEDRARGARTERRNAAPVRHASTSTG